MLQMLVLLFLQTNICFGKFLFKFVSALNARLFLFAMSDAVSSLDPRISAFFH